MREENLGKSPRRSPIDVQEVFNWGCWLNELHIQTQSNRDVEFLEIRWGFNVEEKIANPQLERGFQVVIKILIIKMENHYTWKYLTKIPFDHIKFQLYICVIMIHFS